ncbi:GNAT family N-acetyltransferase [Rubrobacter xylanophilus]|uniref:GNAT family N-acetyltransferase n=1 Tax=Rubrobacter xylanophilus TaxID=49319 RepID=UPI001C63CBF2|nr:GNAT family N-acetyltransferase [Rubrobacter xylanophilus]
MDDGKPGESKVLEIRGYRKEDRGALGRLGALAFGGSPAGWEEYYDPAKNPRLDPSWVSVVEEDGEARSSATILPLEVFVDGAAVPLGGVAAVKTHPAYRRRGYAGALIRHLLGRMRRQGMHLAALWPFSHAFYRAYGWELVSESISYRLDPRQLATGPEQRRIRAHRESDLPQLARLLERRAARHPLGVRRTGGAWNRALKDRELAVYEGEGGTEGYLLYEVSDRDSRRTPPRILRAVELVARSPDARRGLLSFLASQDPEVFEIVYKTSRGEPLHPHLVSAHLRMEVEPEFMLRLVSVEGALGHLRRSPSAPLVLRVADDGLPENAGEYTVGPEGVFRGSGSPHRVSLDVRQLAQLYAGYLPAGRLAELGLIRPSSGRALRLLEELFPSGDPWIFPADHF